MNGACATFTVKKGTKIEEADVATALEDKRMALTSLTKEVRPRAAVAWVYGVTGLG